MNAAVQGLPLQRPIKCVVWDLDHTLWDGTLAEGDDVRLRPGVAALIRKLDQRGVLHSIASCTSAPVQDCVDRRIAEYLCLVWRLDFVISCLLSAVCEISPVLSPSARRCLLCTRLVLRFCNISRNH